MLAVSLARPSPSRRSSLTNAGLYHKLHGVPRPVAMKKTVIKRRKRVPAVGPSVRGSSTQAELASPSTGSTAMPGTPQTATLGVTFGPDGEKTRISPSPIPQTALPAPADRASAMFGSAGYKDQLRRDAASSAAVPLRHAPVTATATGHGHTVGSSGGASGERKMPWWIEDRHDTNKDREAREREGVSLTFLSAHVSSLARSRRRRARRLSAPTLRSFVLLPHAVSSQPLPFMRHRLPTRRDACRTWLARSQRNRSFAPLDPFASSIPFHPYSECLSGVPLWCQKPGPNMSQGGGDPPLGHMTLAKICGYTTNRSPTMVEVFSFRP